MRVCSQTPRGIPPQKITGQRDDGSTKRKSEAKIRAKFQGRARQDAMRAPREVGENTHLSLTCDSPSPHHAEGFPHPLLADRRINGTKKQSKSEKNCGGESNKVDGLWGDHLAGCMPWVATGFSWPPWEKDALVDGIEGKRRERDKP